MKRAGPDDPLEAVPGPAWRCLRNGDGLAYNARYGFALDAHAHADDWREAVHPDDLPGALVLIRGAANDPTDGDVRLRTNTSRWRWFRVTARAVDEEVTCTLTAIDDLHSRPGKHMRLLETLFDQFSSFIFIKDADNNVVAVNRFGAEYFGHTADRLTGQNAYDLYPHEVARTWHEQDREVLDSGRPRLGLIGSYESGGRRKWYQMDKFPLLDEHGQCSHVAAIGTDITALKDVEKRLREQIDDSEALVRILRQREYEQNLILDNIPVMIGYKDTNNRILRVNRFAAESLGIKTSEIYGKHTSTLFPAEAHALHLHDLEVMRTRKPKLDIIQTLTLRSGEVRWYRMHVLPHLFTGGELTGIVFVAEDITALRSLEDELAAGSRDAARG